MNIRPFNLKVFLAVTHLLVYLGLGYGLTACSESGGQERRKDKSKSEDAERDAQAGNTLGDAPSVDDESEEAQGSSDEDDDGDSDGDEDDEQDKDDDKDKDKDDDKYPLKPTFSATELKLVSRGVKKCEGSEVMVLVDDSLNPTGGCVPLDIEDLYGDAEEIAFGRLTDNESGRCPTNAILVGFTATKILCAKLDTKHFKLGTARSACYQNSGGVGIPPPESCDGTPAQPLRPLIDRAKTFMGFDMCLPPVSSKGPMVAVGRSGMKCSDVLMAPLLLKSGDPVLDGW